MSIGEVLGTVLPNLQGFIRRKLLCSCFQQFEFAPIIWLSARTISELPVYWMMKWQSERNGEKIIETHNVFFMIQTHAQWKQENHAYPNTELEQNGIRIRFTTKIRLVNKIHNVKLSQIGFASTKDMRQSISRLFFNLIFFPENRLNFSNFTEYLTHGCIQISILVRLLTFHEHLFRSEQLLLSISKLFQYSVTSIAKLMFWQCVNNCDENGCDFKSKC